VRQLLKKLDAKKATGLDNIFCNLLKLAADILAPSVTFNESIRVGIFPCEWKLAKVTPIFKNGVRSDVFFRLPHGNHVNQLIFVAYNIRIFFIIVFLAYLF